MIAEFGYELLVHRTNEFPFKIFRAMRKFRLLLPATELKVCAETSQEKFVAYIRRSQSLFKVKLHTINVYSSCPSDPNAGILLCFIDTSGTDSICTGYL
jgi:hypothetical protein